ncbi:MAG: putative esterase [Oligoflexia bacterium]|nr:MAG: putative esterase [Oligoflexia bacterium]
MFTYKHRVQFYETDMMGIVHHANYLRFYEEARVDWAHTHGLLDYQQKNSAAQFAVLDTWVRHISPAKFGDELEIQVQAKMEKVRITFEYQMRCPERSKDLLSVARTMHCALDENLKVMRLPLRMREVLEKEVWIETWLSNL